MIEKIISELKNLKFIEKSLKGSWLETLNRRLTETQGKCVPHKVLNEDFFTSKIKKLDTFRSAKSEFKQRVKEDPMFYKTWYSESIQLWLWSLNKVINVIPVEIVDELHESLDLKTIPSKPIFNLPQWSTMIKLGGDNSRFDEQGFAQHYIMFNEVTIDGKDYMFIRTFYTYREHDPVPVSLFLYVAKDSTNLEQGMLKAAEELKGVYKSHTEGNHRCVITPESSTAQDIFNMLLFITGEHSKKEIQATKANKPLPEKYRPINGYKVSVRNKEVIDVIGEEYVEIQKSFNHHQRTFNGRKSHFRKGHHRTYWLGPRNSEQTPVVHWIPPMMVKGRTPTTLEEE